MSSNPTPNPTLLNGASLVTSSLALLQILLANAVQSGLAQEIIADIEAAIAALLKVQGSDVTYGQLEQLRIQPKW